MRLGNHIRIQVSGQARLTIYKFGARKACSNTSLGNGNHTGEPPWVNKTYRNTSIGPRKHTEIQVRRQPSVQEHKYGPRKAHRNTNVGPGRHTKNISMGPSNKKQHTYLVYSNTGVKPGKHAGIQVWGNGNIEICKYGARKAYRNTSNKKVNR